MKLVFETTDQKGRKIHLSEERYKHIIKHPNMQDPLGNIKSAIKNPTAIRYNEEDEKVIYFYKEFKEKEPSERYLLVVVRYLNGEGFIITSFYTNKITGEKWIV